ncbi:MSCRAMM family protein [Catellatospora vulcania]|uniref:MSCRAMM family protein n=1 Tax=Catellatospora vulcania TaxID=1460450 RepID=UPI0012D4BC32|nr:carboxypeptidase-like regulatory domain-containing protein [Catellatospora vulcania]
MRRTPLRRVGLVLLAATIATMGLAAPAHADPDTGTITGHLTYNGQPVADAQVNASGDGWGSASTDSTGRYEITGLTPGPYVVQFQAAGHPEQFAHNGRTWDEAAQIAVTAGAVTTVDESLLPFGTVTGRLVDADGNGLSAYITAQADNGMSSSAWFSDGDFTLGVHPGRYQVQFQFGNGTSQWAYGARDNGAATYFDVAAGQTVTVNDTKLPAGSVAGRITAADGGPAAGVDVQLFEVNGNYGPSAYTEADGTYRIDGVFSGEWRMRVTRESGLQQWYPNVWTEQAAGTVTVTADSVRTVDQQLLPTGSISGHFTDAGGDGLADVSVGLQNAADGRYLDVSATTDADGAYSFPELPAAQYVVRFDGAQGVDQYARGKTSYGAADRVAVTAGQNTVVDDVKLPSGSLKVTAKNAITGAAVGSFSVDVGVRSESTDNGVVTISDLRAGDYVVRPWANGYAATDVPVTITAGEQATVVLTLTPQAKLVTKVVDKATGLPLAGVCVFTILPAHPVLPDGCEPTAADGKVTLNVDPGKVQLFAFPSNAPGYGAQWLGANGGTGLQGQARDFTLTAGQTLTAPTIKMDKAGTITGKVTTKTGGIQYGSVRVLDEGFNVGGGLGSVDVDTDGRYTIDFLGPYQWPLLFKALDHAPQWSGGTGNRFISERITVTAGQTTTYDYKMTRGNLITVKVPGQLGTGFVLVENASAGDVSGAGWTEQSFADGATFRVLGPQTVKIRWIESDGWNWYGGADREHATVVSVPAGGNTVFVLS